MNHLCHQKLIMFVSHSNEKFTFDKNSLGMKLKVASKNNSNESAKVELDNNLTADIADDQNIAVAVVENEKQTHDTINNRNTLLLPEQSKSLLSVPSIYIDNLDSAISTPFDGASLCSIPNTPSISDDHSISEMETVSMIVRNVEEMERNFVEVDLPSQPPQSLPIFVDAPKDKSEKKHHDFIHDLKGKFHQFVHHDASSHSSNANNTSTINNNNSGKKVHAATHDAQHSKSKELLHDLRENVSGKFHQIAERIHHIHLPHVHHHEDTLISQAMQTILLEQFNIAEASVHTANANESTQSQTQQQKRKSSSSSLQSIKQKFNLFQRPRRSVELQSETSSLKSISEVNAISEKSPENNENVKPLTKENVEEFKGIDDNSLLLECNNHVDEEQTSVGSFESAVTVLQMTEQKRKKSFDPEIIVLPTSKPKILTFDQKAISKDDLRLSVRNFDSFILNKKSCDNSFCKSATFTADTNKKPLHESLLSLSRNELLSTSPNVVKTHARTESIGCKFSASPSKQQPQASGSSLPARDASTAIYRRSSDSDLSITPKGKKNYFHT